MRKNVAFVLLILGMSAAAFSTSTSRLRAQSNGNFQRGGVASQQPANASQSTPAQSSRSNELAFVPWQDPAEGAFSLSVPSNWQVSGGTVRTTRIEPHYVVRAQSPDGQVQLFMDDPRIAIRQVPNMMTARMGMREGQLIPAAWGGKVLLERYRPAPDAAADYVRKAICPSASQFQGGIIPGQTQELNNEFGQIAQAERKQIHVDAGEVSFKCDNRLGYAYAITLQAWQPAAPVSLWLIYRIAGYVAQPAGSAAAAAAVHLMLGTFQMNQQWLANFARESNDIAGNVIRESNAITQTTIARAKEQDAQMAAQNAAWHRNFDATTNAISGASRAITGESSANGDVNGHDVNTQLGTKRVCDDVGHCQSVDASVTNWYSDCSGTFYPGSESGAAPSSSTSACWNKGH